MPPYIEIAKKPDQTGKKLQKTAKKLVAISFQKDWSNLQLQPVIIIYIPMSN